MSGMKAYIVIVFFSLIALTTAAQIPEPALLSLKGIGGNVYDYISNNVTSAADGGFIVRINSSSDKNTGNIDSLCSMSGNRVMFVKYDADAMAVQWSKCVLHDGDTLLNYIFPKQDGGNIFVGEYNSFSGWGVYLCRQDAVGNILWSHGYSKGNNLQLSCVMASDDGNYITASGSSYVDSNADVHHGSFTEADILVMKIDSEGNKVWSKVLGGIHDDYAEAIVPAPSGGCYIVGSTNSDDGDCTGNHGVAGGAPDGYIARLDKDGNILWHKDIGGSLGDGAAGAVTDGKGGVIIAAATYSTNGDIHHHKGIGSNIWLLDVDSNGAIVWENCYGGGGYETPNALCKATDGSVWIAGESSNAGNDVSNNYGKGDAWFVHTDSNGNFINAKVLGSNEFDAGYLVWPLSDGNVLAGGRYSAAGNSFQDVFYGATDVFLAVLAPWNQTAVRQFPTGGSDLKIYPNPANDKITINTPIGEDGYLTVYNSIGQQVFATQAVTTYGTVDMDIVTWNAGMYIVKWRGKEGGTSTAKFIKM
jgi:Secretion system C-terminal sorting domain